MNGVILYLKYKLFVSDVLKNSWLNNYTCAQFSNNVFLEKTEISYKTWGYSYKSQASDIYSYAALVYHLCLVFLSISYWLNTCTTPFATKLIIYFVFSLLHVYMYVLLWQPSTDRSTRSFRLMATVGFTLQISQSTLVVSKPERKWFENCYNLQ